ncbi:aconitase family protein [Clostridium sp. SHJSY1]|uniref:aconitase family protein n=1 Tax=Clostridium sp. SHJSY1 TaxID=2942483 RepID=UPI0028749E30|nr:aconitase family protein [Clostridium sp. SHJSY1]MDS0528506.1 aconitase family protein [Clostridium sp. SHJSY1]
MKITMIEKILGEKAGQVVTIKPDYLVINDGIGHKSVDLIDKKRGIADKDKVIIIIDHDVPAGDSEGAAIFQKLVRFSKEYGIKFIQAQGASYAVMLDSYAKAGQVIASFGAHNSIYGSIGALGLNLEVSTMRNLLMSGEYEVKVPETIAIELKGKLSKGISPIDLFITFLGNTSGVNFEGKVIEFIGEGLKNLNNHEKTVLCSMATRTGAFTALVNENLGGNYEKNISLELGEIEAVVAMPTEKKQYESEFKFKKVSELESISLNAGFIGGYTGGYIEDLRLAAKVMKGKRIALGFRLNISPVSSKVYLQAMEEGLLEIFIDFGAQILPPSDRNIILQGAGVIGSEEKMITTGSYNFEGCLGSKNSEVYIASTEFVVAAALTKTFSKL